MPLIVPYVPGMLHDRTRNWANNLTGLVAFLTPLDPNNAAHYWETVSVEWTNWHDTVIVEQDMVPAPGVVERMLSCRRPWCTSPYTIANRTLLTEGLGCVKFAARLKQRHPDLMIRVGEIDDDGVPPRDWHRLDTRIARTLRTLGYAPHTHARSAHLHDYARRP